MPSKVGLLRTYALPVLWLFALPVFALWFSGHAARTFDARFLEVVEPDVRADTRLSATERERALAFYRATPPSVACGGTEHPDYREALGEACGDLDQFRWLQRLALGSLWLGAASLAFALGCTLASFVSRPLQYGSVWLGWNVLKVACALEALLQGIALVFLSYWMTALWLERYSVKLIACVGALVAFAVWKLLVAIFRAPSAGLDVEGELIDEARAPELWQRIRALCAELNTTPPDQLVAGIDDNFFVSEGEVRVGERTLHGRTLFISLSLLRILERPEAEAVLAHEMAHFQGGDTSHSKRLSPLLSRLAQYLHALHEGVVTLPIFHFMLGFYSLIQLSLSRASRERELAADATAARLTSPLHIARSLIKIGAYASYRGRVEEALFEGDAHDAQVAIAQRVAHGFSGYAGTEAVHFDLHEAVTPHPFDSHPPLRERLEHVKAGLSRDQYAALLLSPCGSSWAEAIVGASELEQRLWAAYEARFSAAHELALAYRYLPANDVERAHVERYFPALRFDGKAGEPGVQLDHARVEHAAWTNGTTLSFADVEAISLEKRLFKRYLDLKLRSGGLLPKKRSICLDHVEQADELVEALGRYLGRHRQMTAQRAERTSSSDAA